MNTTAQTHASSDMNAIDDYLDALLDHGPAAVADAPARPGAADGDVQTPAAAMAPAISPPPPPPPPAAVGAADASVASRPPRSSPAAAADAPTTTPLAQTHRWLRVTVSVDSYAVELLRVQEVVRMTPIIAMRGTARAMLGVMNLRGRIVPVFDLGLWLDAGCVQPDERSRIVVVERNDELIGVLVTTVEDVVTLGRDRIEPPLPGSAAGAMFGIARVGAVPTVLLDANALFG